MTLFTIYKLYCGCHFISGGKPSNWAKVTNKVCIVIMLLKLCVTVILIQLIDAKLLEVVSIYHWRHSGDLSFYIHVHVYIYRSTS